MDSDLLQLAFWLISGGMTVVAVTAALKALGVIR
jgi:hypothetical protein